MRDYILARFAHNLIEIWFGYANSSIRTYLQYKDEFASNMIKADATRIFHLANIVLSNRRG